jgi:hypothetical protein
MEENNTFVNETFDIENQSSTLSSCKNKNKGRKQTTKWDTNSTKALLAFLTLRKQEIVILNKSRGRTNPNHPLWLECSEHLKNQYDITYSQEQCYNKFKNLTASHKVFLIFVNFFIIE